MLNRQSGRAARLGRQRAVIDHPRRTRRSGVKQPAPHQPCGQAGSSYVVPLVPVDYEPRGGRRPVLRIERRCISLGHKTKLVETDYSYNLSILQLLPCRHHHQWPTLRRSCSSRMVKLTSITERGPAPVARRSYVHQGEAGCSPSSVACALAQMGRSATLC